MAKRQIARKYLIKNPSRLLATTKPGLSIRVLVFSDGVGSITSNLHIKKLSRDNIDRLNDLAWNLRMDAIESLLLALACAGVDLDSPEFLKGLESALDAILNQSG